MDNSDIEERNALIRALSSFLNYQDYAIKDIIQPRKLKWESLSIEEQSYLQWFPDYIKTLEKCIAINQDFFNEMIEQIAKNWGIEDHPNNWRLMTNYQSYDKVKKLLKQIYREWSEETKIERDQSFVKIIDYLENKYPQIESRQSIKILIPGAGLGRLNFELVSRGFWTQGNEYSYHMLLVSSFILNHSFVANQYQIYPFIHDFSNQLKRNYQTRPIYIPDIHQQTELTNFQQNHPTIDVINLMSMASGSFIDLYGPNDGTISISPHYSKDLTAIQFRDENKENFDFIITNFFIDTSSNIIEYLKAINHSLKQTGDWINFGPLLWHFEDSDDILEIWQDNEKKISPTKGLELTRDDLIQLVKNWFILDVHNSEIDSTYSSDLKKLGNWIYKSEYWIASKKAK
ncbi:hypothetical protein WICMUC_000272 [Wickerhamomyces mucosus]|uniref:carnosine N-methyltransferase n=1 Tax=Wickerhamomyces mucosus TaxID=1378264 RepID=A0A9P8PZM1_9ASCO|nr:hypothetical protein WICMUC_000272 [Wickerhamomyces mucosus]